MDAQDLALALNARRVDEEAGRRAHGVPLRVDHGEERAALGRGPHREFEFPDESPNPHCLDKVSPWGRKPNHAWIEYLHHQFLELGVIPLDDLALDHDPAHRAGWGDHRDSDVGGKRGKAGDGEQEGEQGSHGFSLCSVDAEIIPQGCRLSPLTPLSDQETHGPDPVVVPSVVLDLGVAEEVPEGAEVSLPQVAVIAEGQGKMFVLAHVLDDPRQGVGIPVVLEPQHLATLHHPLAERALPLGHQLADGSPSLEEDQGGLRRIPPTPIVVEGRPQPEFLGVVEHLPLPAAVQDLDVGHGDHRRADGEVVPAGKPQQVEEVPAVVAVRERLVRPDRLHHRLRIPRVGRVVEVDRQMLAGEDVIGEFVPRYPEPEGPPEHLGKAVLHLLRGLPLLDGREDVPEEHVGLVGHLDSVQGGHGVGDAWRGVQQGAYEPVDLGGGDGEPLAALSRQPVLQGLLDEQFHAVGLLRRAGIGFIDLVVGVVRLVGREASFQIRALADLGLVAVLDDVDVSRHGSPVS